MEQATFVTVPDTPLGAYRKVEGPNGGHHEGQSRYYFGAAGTASETPQAHIAACGPSGLFPAHFHHNDQYQVFLGGPDTKFERVLTGRLFVQYADGDTLYGPFENDIYGFRFLTLRPRGGNFTGYMPQDKDKMSHEWKKRHFKIHIGEWFDAPHPGPGEVESEAIIEPHPDGLAAFKVAAGPGATVTGPDPSESGGQYYAILDGEVIRDGSTLPPLTLGWAGPKDKPPVLVGGANGARMLILQFGVEGSLSRRR